MKWNEILYTNVVNYCKLNNLKMGDYERGFGLGKGYMSRQAQKGTLPVSLIMNISKSMNVAIDDLLSEDIFADALKNKHKEELKSKIDELKEELEKLENDDSSDNKTESKIK